MSVHVIQRGNNRMSIFGDDSDFESFLAILEGSAKSHHVDVHGFVLMTSHCHLMVTPQDVTGLPRTMRQVGIRYVKYFNRKYDRIGTLWNGRYRSLLITDERYWLTCLRYVELNPVRANMVVDPADYRWSSYRTHAFGAETWRTPHPIYLALGAADAERQGAYRSLCGVSPTVRELVRLRL